MTPYQATFFLEALAAKPDAYAGGGWVRCSCPLAPWTHKNGKDSNPSFAVSVGEGKESHFNCFSCQSGRVEQLLQTLEFYNQKTPTGKQYNFAVARALLETEALDVFPLPEYSEFPSNEFSEFFEFPDYFIENYPLAIDCQEAATYLANRDVTLEQATAHELRWDESMGMVGFPFRTVYGKLAGMRGRCVREYGLQHYDYSFNKNNNTNNTWYNEQVLENEQPLVIVEGQFDCLAVERAYPNVLANLTARPMIGKLRKLQGCSGVIMMLDGDKTGIEATKSFIKYFDQHKIDCAVIEIPEHYKDPDKWGEENIRAAFKEIGLISV